MIDKKREELLTEIDELRLKMFKMNVKLNDLLEQLIQLNIEYGD